MIKTIKLYYNLFKKFREIRAIYPDEAQYYIIPYQEAMKYNYGNTKAEKSSE